MSLALIGDTIRPKGSVFCSTTRPWKYPRPWSLMERVELFEKSQAFPVFPMAKLPSQLFQEPRDVWVGAAWAMMRREARWLADKTQMYDVCLGVSANNLPPSKSCQTCCSFPRGIADYGLSAKCVMRQRGPRERDAEQYRIYAGRG